MEPAVQNAERYIVVTGDDDELVVGADARFQPVKQPMLGDRRRDDVAREPVKRLPHALSRFDMPPPVETIRFPAVPLSARPDAFLDVPEGFFIEPRVRFRHLATEIDDPLARRTPGQVHAVDPGFKHVGIGPPVRIGRKAQPLPREFSRNVERPALRIPHEGDTAVRRYAPCPGQVDPGPAALGRKVGMDLVYGLAIQARLGPVLIALPGEADQRNPHRCAVDYPRLIRPGVEDRASGGSGLQGPAVRATPYRVGGDQADALNLAGPDLLTRLREPVTDEIGLRRHTSL
ncbi:MAG: hypothetical protein OXP36_06715, partial [Gammaproteobacteria bacterium]|nr:hypothetical protein [Gammaproteobacteria bacterium]